MNIEKINKGGIKNVEVEFNIIRERVFNQIN